MALIKYHNIFTYRNGVERCALFLSIDTSLVTMGNVAGRGIVQARATAST